MNSFKKWILTDASKIIIELGIWVFVVVVWMIEFIQGCMSIQMREFSIFITSFCFLILLAGSGTGCLYVEYLLFEKLRTKGASQKDRGLLDHVDLPKDPFRKNRS